MANSNFVEAGGSVEVPIFDIGIGKCAMVKDRCNSETLAKVRKDHIVPTSADLLKN